MTLCIVLYIYSVSLLGYTKQMDRTQRILHCNWRYTQRVVEGILALTVYGIIFVALHSTFIPGQEKTPRIRPVRDTQNYSEVLREVSYGNRESTEIGEGNV